MSAGYLGKLKSLAGQVADVAGQHLAVAGQVAGDVADRVVGGSVLARATDSSDEPTPGYLFGEISKMTHGTAVQCDKVSDYLIAQLRSNSVIKKRKVLIIYKHIAKTASPRFKRNLQMRTAEVKRCLHFKGPLHDTKGDRPNAAVRAAAKAALDAIFSEKNVSPKANKLSNKCRRGFGGGRLEEGEVAYGNVGLHEPGSYGRRNFDQSSPSVNKNVSMKRNSPEIPGLGASPPEGWSYASNRGKASINKSGTYGLGLSTGNESKPQETAQSDTTKTTPKNSSGKLTGFGKWSKGRLSYTPGDLSGSHSKTNKSESNSSIKNSRVINTKTHKKNEPKHSMSAISDGSFEQSIVDKIICIGGMKAEPPPAEVREFCRKCQSLDANTMAPMIEEKLLEDHWQVQTKGLSIIRALVQNDHCGKYKEYFVDNIDVIEELQSSEKVKVRLQVKKVLRALEATSKEVTSSKAKNKRSGRRNPATLNIEERLGGETNLLEFGDSDEKMSKHVEAVQPSKALENMFGGMDILDDIDGSIAPNQEKLDLSSETKVFGFMESNQEGRTFDDNLFSGMGIKSPETGSTNSNANVELTNDLFDSNLPPSIPKKDEIIKTSCVNIDDFMQANLNPMRIAASQESKDKLSTPTPRSVGTPMAGNVNSLNNHCISNAFSQQNLRQQRPRMIYQRGSNRSNQLAKQQQQSDGSFKFIQGMM